MSCWHMKLNKSASENISREAELQCLLFGTDPVERPCREHPGSVQSTEKHCPRLRDLLLRHRGCRIGGHSGIIQRQERPLSSFGRSARNHGGGFEEEAFSLTRSFRTQESPRIDFLGLFLVWIPPERFKRPTGSYRRSNWTSPSSSPVNFQPFPIPMIGLIFPVSTIDRKHQ
jgi:hypothetical protein